MTPEEAQAEAIARMRAALGPSWDDVTDQELLGTALGQREVLAVQLEALQVQLRRHLVAQVNRALDWIGWPR